MGKKRKYSEEVLIPLINSSNSVAEVMIKLGLEPRGSNYSIMKNRIESLGLKFREKIYIPWNKKSDDEFIQTVLIEDGPRWTSFALKTKILTLKLIENKCSECGCLPVWNSKPLVLQLDHINGNPRDNRLQNLRLLCPNCHTQTETYNIGKKKIRE